MMEFILNSRMTEFILNKKHYFFLRNDSYFCVYIHFKNTLKNEGQPWADPYAGSDL